MHIFIQRSLDADSLTRTDLGGGLSAVSYRADNGYGGYHDVAYELQLHGRTIRRLTTPSGRILRFPGYVQIKGHPLPPWAGHAAYPLYEHIVRFSSHIEVDRENPDAWLLFYWTFQPSGRYFSDDDGFGSEDMEEIELFGRLDRQGTWITPFQPVGWADTCSRYRCAMRIPRWTIRM